MRGDRVLSFMTSTSQYLIQRGANLLYLGAWVPVGPPPSLLSSLSPSLPFPLPFSPPSSLSPSSNPGGNPTCCTWSPSLAEFERVREETMTAPVVLFPRPTAGGAVIWIQGPTVKGIEGPPKWGWRPGPKVMGARLKVRYGLALPQGGGLGAPSEGWFVVDRARGNILGG